MDLRELPSNVVDLPLFTDLVRDEIAGVLKRCNKLFLSAGQYLMRAGELADCCYLILKGRIEIRTRKNRETITLATLEAGQLVGEMGLFRDKPYRMADAMIIRDSHLVQLPYAYLKRLEGVAPEIGAKLKRNLQVVATQRVKVLASQINGEPQDSPGGLAGPPAAGAAVGAAVSPQRDVSSPEPVPLVPIQIKMALSRCPIFEGFDEDDLHHLTDRVVARRFQAGQPVFMAGDRADSVYVVVLGRLTVLAEIEGELHDVADLHVGQCFGETPLASSADTRSASVIAGSTSTVLRIAYSDLREATGWRPQTKERFESNLARLAVDRIT